MAIESESESESESSEEEEEPIEKPKQRWKKPIIEESPRKPQSETDNPFRIRFF